jgi:Tfp pilus assembly protein PilX
MKRDEQGIALVITLFLMATLSALSVSMMFLAQTETAASRNYRTMSQARYAAESGVHKSINYLLNTYASPGSLSAYNTAKTPVTCLAGCGYTASAGASCTASSLKTAVESGCVVESSSVDSPPRTITKNTNTTTPSN